MLPVIFIVEIYISFFSIKLRNFWTTTTKKMLKWRFEPIFDQNKQPSEMWKSQSAKFSFYYNQRKIENVIRHAVLCNILCFLWSISYCTLNSFNWHFKQLHKNKSSEEMFWKWLNELFANPRTWNFCLVQTCWKFEGLKSLR